MRTHQVLQEQNRNHLMNRLSSFGFTQEQMNRMSYQELKKQLAIKQLTDGELKTREQWF